MTDSRTSRCGVSPLRRYAAFRSGRRAPAAVAGGRPGGGGAVGPAGPEGPPGRVTPHRGSEPPLPGTGGALSVRRGSPPRWSLPRCGTLSHDDHAEDAGSNTLGIGAETGHPWVTGQGPDPSVADRSPGTPPAPSARAGARSGRPVRAPTEWRASACGPGTHADSTPEWLTGPRPPIDEGPTVVQRGEPDGRVPRGTRSRLRRTGRRRASASPADPRCVVAPSTLERGLPQAQGPKPPPDTWRLRGLPTERRHRTVGPCRRSGRARWCDLEPCRERA